MQYDEAIFTECRKLIEAKLSWGDSKGWTNADFETLSERIFTQTGVNLSTSTLKRLWGKVKYDSVPQAATLNALASFAGYENYREFELAYRKDKLPVEKYTPVASVALAEHTTSPQVNTSKKRRLAPSVVWSIGLFMGISLSLLLAFSLSVKQKSNNMVDPALFSFSSRPVSEGIPNSVVFTLDASAARTDCLFVQQSWNPKLRFKVKKEQTQATSIYYYPGFFKAKLLVDNQIVKEHDLLIKTKGWLPLIEQEPVPVYYSQEETIGEGMMRITAEQVAKSNIPLQPVVPSVWFYNVRDFGNLSSQAFTLETSLKNTYAKGSGACQQSQVIVICETNAFTVPLSIPGCTSDINAYFSGKLLKGSHTDLSSLGVNFSNWVKLRLEVKNKGVQVFINDKPALQSDFFLDAGKVIGIAYRFQGTGAVDYVHLSDEKGNRVLEEEF
jgi:hypothetical protein